MDNICNNRQKNNVKCYSRAGVLAEVPPAVADQIAAFLALVVDVGAVTCDEIVAFVAIVVAADSARLAVPLLGNTDESSGVSVE